MTNQNSSSNSQEERRLNRLDETIVYCILRSLLGKSPEGLGEIYVIDTREGIVYIFNREELSYRAQYITEDFIEKMKNVLSRVARAVRRRRGF